MLDIQELEINMGPQHPATHGVLRIKLKLDGERITYAKPVIGYLHRGAEKIFESQTYSGNVPHTDRLDCTAAATNNHAYCRGRCRYLPGQRRVHQPGRQQAVAQRRSRL